MSNLTGQQINLTYPGLLNLSAGTSGITSSLQSIQDGYGNNTGSRISTSGITSPNISNQYTNAFNFDCGGTGYLSAGALTPGASSQNNTLFGYFYDAGYAAYSSITVNITTQSTTGDVAVISFYDLQWVPSYGMFPKTKLSDNQTLPFAIGNQTATFTNPVSFSGSGGGWYAYTLNYFNSGVTPTLRYATSVAAVANQSYLLSLGFVRNTSNNGQNAANRATSYAGSTLYWLTGQTTPSVFTQADIITRFSTTTSVGQLGFALNTIR